MPTTSDSIITTTLPQSWLPEALPAVTGDDAAPSNQAELSSLRAVKAVHIEGKPPRERAMLPGYDSGVVCVLLGLFIFVVVNFKHYSTFLRTLIGRVWNVRKRENAFNEHNTVSETRLLVSMIMMVCFGEGALLFSHLYNTHVTTAPAVFTLLSVTMGVATAYYLLQLVAYATVGWTFGSSREVSQWLRGFNASQSLLGIAMIVPALVTLFYPETTAAMCGIGVVLYVVARILFICKGFKIFYHNLFSLVYFILYLCALEIAPLLIMYRGRSLILSQ